MSGAPSARPSLPDRLNLILLQPGHLGPVAAMLGEAFKDDPLTVYYLPDPDQRRRVLPGMMLSSLRYCLRYGEVWTTPELDGAACWLPPAHVKFSTFGLARAALGAVPLSLGWRTIGRMLRFEARLDALHAANLPEPHWYLMLLGVSPARAGQGVGSQLIASKMAQIQAEGVPVYLETMLGSNVDFYRKRGFRVLDEAELAPGGPHVWAMAAGLCGL
jgi:ribosomal protein S18 acetylase RimI-like enzyme